jgi:hypothetical protein
MQGQRDGALKPPLFTLVSSSFWLIWRSQLQCYSRKALVSDSSISRRVLLELERACRNAIGCWSSVRALFFSRQESSTLDAPIAARLVGGGRPNHSRPARHGSENSKLPCWSVEAPQRPPHRDRARCALMSSQELKKPLECGLQSRDSRRRRESRLFSSLSHSSTPWPPCFPVLEVRTSPSR